MKVKKNKHLIDFNQEFQIVLLSEINWCEQNRGSRTKQFEDGFVSGLYQAHFLYEKYLEIKNKRKQVTK